MVYNGFGMKTVVGNLSLNKHVFIVIVSDWFRIQKGVKKKN